MFKKLKEKRDKIMFEDGYRYAAAEILRGRKPPFRLSTQSIYHVDMYKSFDNGMLAAAEDAIERGL